MRAGLDGGHHGRFRDGHRTYTYDVFGAVRAQTGATANGFRFTGQQQDYNAGRGLLLLRARHYEPTLGRSLQRDPLPFVQRYAYSGGAHR